MKNPQQYFDDNGYVVLQNALTQQQCQELTQHMFNLREQGVLVKDDQCPLSDAVYGDPVFDKLLADFAEPIGKQVGKKLLPTYTYARIYYPGEVLKKHKDRPSCEISATLTLGFDAKAIWPIYFDEEKEIMVQLDRGELAVYKGCEICHWRKPFKGEWHVQVFLHYVDADGPFADHAYDGRQQLGVDKSAPVQAKQQTVDNPYAKIEQPIVKQQQEPISIPAANFNGVIFPSPDKNFPGYYPIFSEHQPWLMFSREQCDKIVSIAKDSYPSTASVGGSSDNSRIARDIRMADIYNIENNDESKWIYEKVANAVQYANITHFDYELVGITHSLQLIHYVVGDEKGHYDMHIDAGRGEPATRKISFTAQLTDPSTYGGCDLIVNDHANIVTGPREQGSMSLFPSYMPHQVTDIEWGERYALVIWIHGSRRFK